MDRLKKYDFLDENGHRLEDCADYLAIFSEHEAELARVKAVGIEALRRAEQAEADKAALEEDLEATEKNLKESSGFIEELLSGLKHRFPVQYANLEGDEYGDDAFSSHDLFEIVIDPAVNAAQKAESTRLRAERDWLADKLSDHCLADGGDCNIPICPTYIACRNATPKVWIEAASRAVAAGEETCPK